ncbi:MAG TPA: hypothetical protein VF484_03655 [Candidatus Limnocylindrales bacterium]
MPRSHEAVTGFPFHPLDERPEVRVTSNVGQSYPYSSETEAQRAAAVTAYVGGHEGSADKLKAETTPLDANDRWWTWKCPTAGCPGILHAAGYALDKHALYVVCDGTCGKTFLR